MGEQAAGRGLLGPILHGAGDQWQLGQVGVSRPPAIAGCRLLAAGQTATNSSGACPPTPTTPCSSKLLCHSFSGLDQPASTTISDLKGLCATASPFAAAAQAAPTQVGGWMG